MNRVFVLLLVTFAALLLLTGCDREIKGNVVSTDNTNENCFECHNGLLDQAQGEWANSIHASGNTVDYTNRGGSDCTKCHDEQGYISYLATGTLPSEPFENVSGIGCFTCHDPHGNGDMRIRFVGSYTLENGDVFDHGNGNQCASCHHSRISAGSLTDNFNVTSPYWGTHHGPQSDLLNGSNGYEFPGEGYTFSTSPHALVVDDACIGCHMGNPRTHLGYKIGGHSLNMEDEETGDDLHSLCADESCHGSEATSYDFTADEDYDHDGTIEGNQTEIAGLMDSLAVLLEGEGVLSGDHPVTGVIADGNVVGALYNYIFLTEDRSHGVHNFNYARSLLDASIDYLSGLAVGKSDIIADKGKNPDLMTSH